MKNTISTGFSSLVEQNPLVRFMFDPPDDANGQPNNPNPNEPAIAPYADPFKDMDITTLDDATRGAIEKTRAEGQRLATEAAAARQHQSRADKNQAELQRLQREIQSKTQTPLSGKEPTLEDEIAQEYIQMGIAPAEAAKVASVQAKVLGKFAQRQNAHIGQALQPTLQTVADQQASFNYQSVLQDAQFLQQAPEVAQELWDRVAEATKAGQTLSPGAILQLGKMLAFDHYEANPAAKPVNLPPPVNTQQNSRFTFPGAGSLVRSTPAVQLANNPALNQDTQDALSVIQRNWKSELAGKSGVPVQSKITRGGM